MTLIDLYKLAERENIDVDSFKFDKIEALSIKDDFGFCHIAIDPFKLKSNADEKDKLAHEMGHCITGSFYNRYSVHDLKEKHENRANRWEYKNLVPYNELILACKNGYDEPYKLADYFELPQQTIEKAIEYYKQVENRNFL